MDIGLEMKDLNGRQTVIHEAIASLMAKLPQESATRKQLDNYRELFDDAVSYLSNPN